jgi:hypothetical protein
MSARASGTVRTPNADPACVRDLGRTLPTLASRAPLCAPRIAHDGGVSGRLSRPRQQSSPAGLCGSTGRALADGRVFSGGYEARVRWWDPATPGVVHEIDCSVGALSARAIPSAQATLLVIADADAGLSIWTVGAPG